MGGRAIDEARASHLSGRSSSSRREGLTHPAARVSARLGVVEWRSGQLDEALERMERAFEVLSGDEPDEDLATLAAELGRLHFFRGDIELADAPDRDRNRDRGVLWLPEVLSQALNTQGLIASCARPLGAVARAASSTRSSSRSSTISPTAALRAYNNLGDLLDRRDRYEEAIEMQQRGIALARKAGDRHKAGGWSASCAWCLFSDGPVGRGAGARTGDPGRQLVSGRSRGLNSESRSQPSAATLRRRERVIVELLAGLEDSADVQERGAMLRSARSSCAPRAVVSRRRTRGREEACASVPRLGLGHSRSDAKIAFGMGLESALRSADSTRSRS